MMEAYRDEIDKQREVCELRGQLSRATITEAEPVQDESPRQIPNSTTVHVGRQGEKQATAADQNVGVSRALGLDRQATEFAFESEAKKKKVTTSEQLKASKSTTPVSGIAEDFTKKGRGDRKSQVTAVRVGLQPQEWGDGEKKGEFDGKTKKQMTEIQESQRVHEIETLRRENNAMQRKIKELTDRVTDLEQQLSRSKYELSLVEEKEGTLQYENRELHQRVKEMEDRNRRSATASRQEYRHETKTPASTHHLTTDSALPPTPKTQQMETDM